MPRHIGICGTFIVWWLDGWMAAWLAARMARISRLGNPIGQICHDILRCVETRPGAQKSSRTESPAKCIPFHSFLYKFQFVHISITSAHWGVAGAGREQEQDQQQRQQKVQPHCPAHTTPSCFVFGARFNSFRFRFASSKQFDLPSKWQVPVG